VQVTQIWVAETEKLVAQVAQVLREEQVVQLATAQRVQLPLAIGL
jgi:hypothetical protein